MSTATQQELIGTGDTLPNGWTVVDINYDRSQEKFGDYAPQGIVLAMLPEGIDRFATWNFIIDARFGHAYTTTGHYFNHIFNAAKDFSRRIGNRGEGE